jgi:hypothetical protein
MMAPIDIGNGIAKKAALLRWFSSEWLCGLPRLKYVHNIHHFPKALGDPSGHCRRRTERLMDANEIVVHREQRDGMRVVFNFFAEPVRQSCKSARMHPNIEILAFRKRRADVLHIGVAFDPVLTRASALRGAIMALGAI